MSAPLDLGQHLRIARIRQVHGDLAQRAEQVATMHDGRALLEEMAERFARIKADSVFLALAHLTREGAARLLCDVIELERKSLADVTREHMGASPEVEALGVALGDTAERAFEARLLELEAQASGGTS